MSFELEGHLEFGLDCLTVVGNGTTGLVLEVVGADVESQTRSNRVLCTNGGVGSFKLCTAVVVLGVGLTNTNFKNVANGIHSTVGNCFFLKGISVFVGRRTSAERKAGEGNVYTCVCAFDVGTCAIVGSVTNRVGNITHGTAVLGTHGSGCVVVSVVEVGCTETELEASEGRAEVVQGTVFGIVDLSFVDFNFGNG